MFERFTDRARRVVTVAQEEARFLDHNYIGTEHLLLGLLGEGEGVAAKALDSLNVSFTAVRKKVEDLIGRGDSAPVGHIPFTPRAKKVLELALREALQLGHNYIGTEHILLGLAREGDGIAATVLTEFGADMEAVRRQVLLVLTGKIPSSTPPAVAVIPRAVSVGFLGWFATFEHQFGPFALNHPAKLMERYVIDLVGLT